VRLQSNSNFRVNISYQKLYELKMLGENEAVSIFQFLTRLQSTTILPYGSNEPGLGVASFSPVCYQVRNVRKTFFLSPWFLWMDAMTSNIIVDSTKRL
jgi:hypothetical protein